MILLYLCERKRVEQNVQLHKGLRPHRAAYNPIPVVLTSSTVRREVKVGGVPETLIQQLGVL